jgi:hypothetical protein
MEILLQKLPRLRGIYDGKVPTWACYLYPEAARSLLRIESETGGLVYTSVWRSANGSLWAIKNKSGAMPPGFSAHNYGLAVDITIDQVLKETAWSYETLYDYMEGFGWYCHRRDKKERFEKWHFNYLGIPPLHLDLASGNSRTWHLPVEQRIQDLYGMHFEMDTRGVQKALRKLKFYHERVDGLWGPYSRGALNSFQRAYKMRETRNPTARAKRTLAFCTAKKKVV